MGNFEKFLKASGIIKSANSFDFSVDHNIDIVPIPSFEIAFDNNNDDHHLLLEIDSDKLEITISQSNNAFSMSLPERNQPIEHFAISWSLDPVRSFGMKLDVISSSKKTPSVHLISIWEARCDFENLRLV